MKKYLILFCFLILYTDPVLCQSFGKNGYKIKGVFTNVEKDIDTLLLISYKAVFNSTATLAIDTSIINNSTIVFEGNEILKSGMYFIFEPKGKTFFMPPFLLTKQDLSFKGDAKDPLNSMEFYKSKENDLFYEYQKHVSKKQKLRNELKNKLENNKSQSKSINTEIAEIDKQMKEYINTIVANNKETLFAKYIKSTQPIDIPNIPLNEAGEKDIVFQYNYIKNHFWDNYDLSDSRMIYTANFAEMMDQYFNYIEKSTRNPDSINAGIKIVAKKSINSEEMFRYVVEFAFTKYEKSWKKIMGMDKILVYIAENYVMTGLCSWIEKERSDLIIERAEKIAPNLIGKKAPEFIVQQRPFMQDTSGNFYSLKDIDADYTMLIFYSPDCGHCKKQMPKIKSVYDSLITSKINIKTLAITNGFDRKEWIEFINEFEIGGWINIGDQPFKIKKNYAYVLKKESNTYISADMRKNYNKGDLKKVEIENFLIDDNKNLNLDLFKKVKEEYKNAKFIQNNDGVFMCEEELEPRASSNWREKYDIISTPVVYLLDKDKRIRAKGLNHAQIGNIIRQLEERLNN